MKTALESLDALEALARKMAAVDVSPTALGMISGGLVYAPVEHYREARAIVAELPKPVDPDLIEARRMESQQADNNGFIDYAVSVRNGDQDNEGPVRCRYDGIKRGRELAREEGVR